MKKSLIAAAALLVGLSFTSCKKDYTCECTVTMGGQTLPPVKGTIKNSTKKDAQASCNDLQKKSQTSTPGATVSCSLK